MTRETQYSFAALPETEIGRSKFDRSFNHSTTWNNGNLIPIYCEHVMPGDTVNMNISSLVRMLTPMTPVMDSLYMDIMFFYVPYRLIWDNFKYFLGENKEPWKQAIDYRFPKMKLYSGDANDTSHKVEVGSLLNYLGIPLNLGLGASDNQSSTNAIDINALPVRAYCKIYNDWWKSEAVEKDLYLPTDDTTQEIRSKSFYDILIGADINNAYKACYRGATPAKVNREFDYFSACLPEPQRGPSVLVPILGEAPIVYGKSPKSAATGYYDTPANPLIDKSWTGEKAYIWNIEEPNVTRMLTEYETGIPNGIVGSAVSLMADLESATGASVNAIRTSFAIQKFYERQARYGTRYGEVIQGHFNTTNPDIMIGRSEYLGGRRFPISINQVVAQGNTPEGLPLGDTGGYSVTSDVSKDIFTKSFTEWGIIMGVMCTRTHRSYQQGINRFWFMDKITDMYWPEFANLGEQIVKEAEIYAQDGDNISHNDDVFGYQEAWAHYRYSPDMITGELSSLYNQPLDIWHYADYYESAPTLSQKWMEEPIDNVKRTLAYQEGHQFKGDFYFKATWTRPMPLYSIPGLVDHH